MKNIKIVTPKIILFCFIKIFSLINYSLVRFLFFRALKRRIRAEELLKASSLPPSMAQRELTKAVKPICPRALREIEREIDNQILEQEKQELQQLKLSNRSPCGRDSQNSFITTSRPFKFHTEQRIKKRARSVSLTTPRLLFLCFQKFFCRLKNVTEPANMK